jgi:class 3 adenylate cyclase
VSWIASSPRSSSSTSSSRRRARPPLGDAQWAALLEQYYAVVRREVSRFRGEEVNTAGDGFFSSFDGPARAARCAVAIRDAVASLGLQIRAGLHTGECEVIDGQLGGIAVHIGARVAAHAEPGEILASSTVRDLVVRIAAPIHRPRRPLPQGAGGRISPVPRRGLTGPHARLDPRAAE